MKCPLCNTEMRITNGSYVQNDDGELFFRQTLTCRNKNCSNHGMTVKTIYTPLTVTTDSEATE